MMIAVNLLSVAVKADVCQEASAILEENRPSTTVSMDSNACQGAAGKEHVLT